jgi:hypothetical protein
MVINGYKDTKNRTERNRTVKKKLKYFMENGIGMKYFVYLSKKKITRI